MQCCKCGLDIVFTSPHVVTACKHAYHAHCLGPWSAPDCVVCKQQTPSERAERKGAYKIDAGNDPERREALMAAAQAAYRVVPPPQTRSLRDRLTTTSRMWTVVDATRAGTACSDDILGCGASWDTLHAAGVTLQHLVDAGVSETEAVSLGYDVNHLLEGAAWPAAGGNTVLKPHMQPTAAHSTACGRVALPDTLTF